MWHKPGIALTKIGSFVPISSLVEKNEGDDRDVAQSIHVLEKGQEKSQLIVGLEYSLLKLLSVQALYILRLYVLLPLGKEHLMGGISDTVHKFIKA